MNSLHEIVFGTKGTLVIAEIGINHDGSVDKARRLIDAVAAAGANCIKFQTFRTESFIQPNDSSYKYVSGGVETTEDQYAMFKRLELPYSAFDELFQRARAKGLVPLSTPVDEEAVQLLDDLGVPAFKVGSDDLVHLPFIELVASRGRPLILSTGMATFHEVREAVAAAFSSGCPHVALLHCVSLYPTPDHLVNLERMVALKDEFSECEIGFSDHSEGRVAAVCATALGASIIEKHFTLNCDEPGPDHRFSLDPSGLREFVSDVRKAEAMLKSGEEMSEQERGMATVARRSIHLAVSLEKGTPLSLDHFAFRRPGDGIPPSRARSLVGRSLARDLVAGTKLRLEDVD